jgi:hypothetical protein
MSNINHYRDPRQLQILDMKTDARRSSVAVTFISMLIALRSGECTFRGMKGGRA